MVACCAPPRTLTDPTESAAGTRDQPAAARVARIPRRGDVPARGQRGESSADVARLTGRVTTGSPPVCCAANRSGACATFSATLPAVGGNQRPGGPGGSCQRSPRRHRQPMTRLAAVVKEFSSSGADQASCAGNAAVSTAKARMASRLATSAQRGDGEHQRGERDDERDTGRTGEPVGTAGLRGFGPAATASVDHGTAAGARDRSDVPTRLGEGARRTRWDQRRRRSPRTGRAGGRR